MKSCCAVGCTNRHYKGCGLSFYTFPTDSYRCNKWIAVIKRELAAQGTLLSRATDPTSQE